MSKTKHGDNYFQSAILLFSACFLSTRPRINLRFSITLEKYLGGRFKTEQNKFLKCRIDIQYEKCAPDQLTIQTRSLIYFDDGAWWIRPELICGFWFNYGTARHKFRQAWYIPKMLKKRRWRLCCVVYRLYLVTRLINNNERTPTLVYVRPIGNNKLIIIGKVWAVWCANGGRFNQSSSGYYLHLFVRKVTLHCNYDRFVVYLINKYNSN